MSDRLKEIAEHLRHVPMLSSVPPDYLRAVAATVKPQLLRRHQVLFREGEHGDSLAVVTKGRLAVRRRVPDGHVDVGVVYPGEVVGEMSCVDPQPRNASVVATVESEVLTLSRNAFNAMADQSKTLAVALRGAILHVLTQRLRETNARIEATLAARGIDSSAALAPITLDDMPEPEDASGGRLDLTKVSCLRNFELNELKALVEVAPPKTYPAGYVLCVEGKPGDSCYIIARGTVDISRRVRGEERHLARLSDGAMIGQLALIDGAPRAARVTAASSVVALRLSRSNFNRLLSGRGPFGIRFQAQLAVAGVRQLRAATERLAMLMDASRPSRKAPTDTKELSVLQAAIEQWDMELTRLFDKAEEHIPDA